MTRADFIALLPLLLLAGLAVVGMVVVAFWRRHAVAAGLGAATCLLTLGSLPIAAGVAPRAVTTLIQIDGFALFYLAVVLAGTLLIIGTSYGYLERQPSQGEHAEEFYVLLLLATLGAAVLVTAVHFVSLFLGLELVGVSLYALIAYFRAYPKPVEAALKYVILSAASSAFLLFGMALIYFETGTMEFGALARALGSPAVDPVLFFAGIAMMLTAIGFKLAIVPFHMWAPDVYQGAPAPTTAFVATVSKTAMFALVLRYVTQLDLFRYRPLWIMLALIAVASMFTGNLLALLQRNVKRLLAYSSIAHLGYLLVALLAAGPLALEAVTYYLVAYLIMTIGAFAVVAALSDAVDEAEDLDDYAGLFWRRPWLAACFTLMLLSLAGIPLTVGFIGKFYAIAAGLGAGLWYLVLLLIVNSVIGVFYYLRVIVAMAAQPAYGMAAPHPTSNTWAGALSLAALTFLLVWLGVYPDPVIQLIQTTVGRLLS